MRISSNPQINLHPEYQPNFQSSRRWEFGPNNKVIVNYTKFMREDLDFKKFIRILELKYKYAPKVNILNLACSDGSESLSLMAALIHFLKEENASKFFPIIASDIDSYIIKSAKSGFHYANDDDLSRINATLGHYSDYFSIAKACQNTEGFSFALSPLLKYKNNVIFKESDMLYALNDLQPKNNVVLCRNALPYLQTEKVNKMLDMFAEKLDNTSLLVIGQFDNGHYINDDLKKRGFRPYGIENVYAKP